MKTWDVQFTITKNDSEIIEADTEEDAKQKLQERFQDDADLAVEVVDVEEREDILSVSVGEPEDSCPNHGTAECWCDEEDEPNWDVLRRAIDTKKGTQAIHEARVFFIYRRIDNQDIDGKPYAETMIERRQATEFLHQLQRDGYFIVSVQGM